MSEAGPVSALQMYGESNLEDIGSANAENIRAGEFSIILHLRVKPRATVIFNFYA